MPRCRGSALRNKITNVFTYEDEKHNHDPAPGQKDVATLKRVLLTRAQNELTPLKEIYNLEIERLPVAAVHLKWDIRKLMQEARQMGRPELPATAAIFADQLANDDRAKKFCEVIPTVDGVETENLFKNILGNEGSEILIFTCQPLLDVLQGSHVCIADATFDCVPRRPAFRQMLTIHGEHAMGQIFPCVFVLMAKKSQASYVLLLQYLKGLIPDWNPIIILLDYERALQNAFRVVFPDGGVKGCWFHFSQATWRMIKKKGLVAPTRGNLGQRVINMIMCLPLLPAEKIEEGVEGIKRLIRNNVELYERLEDFLNNYVLRHWCQQVGTETVSVHQQLRRTTNDAEAFHSYLNTGFRPPHPNAWVFMEKMKRVINEKLVKLHQANQMKNNQPWRSDEEIERDRRIDAAQTRLAQDRRYNVLNFLSEVSDLQEPEQRLLRDILREAVERDRAEGYEYPESEDEEDEDDPAEPAAAQPAEAQANPPPPPRPLCLICKERPTAWYYHPCGHNCVCDPCRHQDDFAPFEYVCVICGSRHTLHKAHFYVE